MSMHLPTICSGSKPGHHGRERRSVFPQQLARRPVDVGNDEIAINHHDGGRDLVYDVALESGHIVVSARNAS